jgi:hypothetical protein
VCLHMSSGRGYKEEISDYSTSQLCQHDLAYQLLQIHLMQILPSIGGHLVQA